MNIMDKLVSIIIPAYNRASMIERALRSVTCQDHANLEIIVVDDASGDNTEEVVRAIRDSRIIYVRRPQNGGAASARNTGIRQAKGEYVAFLDSDDEFAPGKIRKQVRLFEKLSPPPGLIFTNYWEEGRRRKINIARDVPSGYVDTSKTFPASVFCNPPSCWMLRRICLEEELFDELLWTMEDIDLFARIVRKYPVYFFNEPLMIKHVHACKKGNVPIRYAEQTGERILEKWLPEMRRDKRFLTRFYCTMGKDLIRCGKKQKALDHLWKAFLLDPLSGRVFQKLVKTWMSYEKT
jgi:glycosyltransferase involved in cell wall biosynthesis